MIELAEKTQQWKAEPFRDFLPPGQTMRHYMDKLKWANADAETRESLVWWWGSRARLFKTVAAFQPRDRA